MNDLSRKENQGQCLPREDYTISTVSRKLVLSSPACQNLINA